MPDSDLPVGLRPRNRLDRPCARHTGLKIEGPEYETIYAFGGLCAIDSIEEIIYLNDLCDRLGIDTITAGNLCGLAIEAARNGKSHYKVDYSQVDAIAQLLIEKGIFSKEELFDMLKRIQKEYQKSGAPDR